MQQIFNVGLSFDYDHTSSTTKNEEPSLYRLRARAAKTAIKYIQYLKNDNPEYKNQILNNPKISTNKKIKLMKEYEKNIQSDINYYKEKLLNSLNYATESLPDGISFDDLNVIVSQSTSIRKRDYGTVEARLGESPILRQYRDINDDYNYDYDSIDNKDLLDEYDIVNQFKKNRMNNDGNNNEVESSSSSSEWDYVTTIFDKDNNAVNDNDDMDLIKNKTLTNSGKDDDRDGDDNDNDYYYA